MKTVKMHEAKTNFSKLILGVEQGEEVIVQRGDTPVARIVPFAEGGKPRKAGALKGKLVMAPDFDTVPEGFEDYVG